MNCNYIEIGGKKNNNFIRNIMTTTLLKNKKIKELNLTDTYTSVYTYNNKNQDLADIVAPLYIDLDINDLKEDFDKLKKDLLLIIRQLKIMFCLTDENLDIYFSGSKGFHILVDYKIFGIKPNKVLNTEYKSIAVLLKSYTVTKCVDTRIYDKKRLFRVPNSINTKTNLYKVQIDINSIRDLTYEQLLEYAKQPQNIQSKNNIYREQSAKAYKDVIERIQQDKKKNINHKVAKQLLINKELLPCVKYILQNGADKGGRNNTAMALASALYQREPDKEQEILETMITWNDTKLNEPIAYNELRSTVMSAYRNVRDGKRYGCGSFIDLGICIKDCPVRRK